MKTCLAISLLLITPFAWSAMELTDDTDRRPTSTVTRAVALTRPPTEEPSLRVELKDGSRIVGRLVAKNVPLTVTSDAIGAMRIPFDKIRTLQFDKDGSKATVLLQNNDTLRGVITLDALKLVTLFGNVTLPVTQITRVHFKTGVSAPLPEGCVLAYSFDADEGDRVTDRSGNENHGRVKGAVFVPDGKIGGAMRFDGRSSAISLENSASLRLQNFSIMAWAKRDGASTKSAGATDCEIFGYDTGGYAFAVRDEGTLLLSQVGLGHVYAPVRLTGTNFHHVAVTKDGSRIMFYLDGAAYPAPDYDPVFQFESTPAVGAIGGRHIQSFWGLLDEVAIFNRALPATEIKALYDSQQ